MERRCKEKKWSTDPNINSYFVRTAIRFKVADKTALIITFCFKIIPDFLPRLNYYGRHRTRTLENRIIACLNCNRGKFSASKTTIIGANNDSV